MDLRVVVYLPADLPPFRSLYEINDQFQLKESCIHGSSKKCIHPIQEVCWRDTNARPLAELSFDSPCRANYFPYEALIVSYHGSCLVDESACPASTEKSEQRNQSSCHASPRSFFLIFHVWPENVIVHKSKA